MPSVRQSILLDALAGVSAVACTAVALIPQGLVRYRRVGYAATADFGSWLAGTVEQLRSAGAPGLIE